jgi:hypothetical protein
MKFKINATIPTGSYANIQPEIEVEAETYEQAKDEAMTKLADIWQQYGNVPLVKTESNRKELEAFVGGTIYYDAVAHVYTNKLGEVYLSGSQYAAQFKKPFDKQAIALAMAKKAGCDPSEIIAMWELNGEASRDFGNAIHKALQLYEQHRELVIKLGGLGNVHKHPVIKNAVESFVEAHKNEKALSEVLVVDHAAKYAGQIDRLLITGDKACRVQDFKTNASIDKDLESYWQQLGFYGKILQAAGWTVEGLDIFHFNGEWKTYTYKRKEVKDGAASPSKQSKRPATKVA